MSVSALTSTTTLWTSSQLATMPVSGQRLAVGDTSLITLENFSPYWMMLSHAPNPPPGSVQGILIKPWTHTTHRISDCKGWAYVTPVNESGAVSVAVPYFEENPYVAATVTNVPGPVPGAESSYLTHSHVTNALSIASGRIDVGTISGTVTLAADQIVQVSNVSGGSLTVAGQVNVSQAAGDVLSITGAVNANVTAGTVSVSSGTIDVGSIASPVSIGSAVVLTVAQESGTVYNVAGAVDTTISGSSVTLNTNAAVTNVQVGIGANYQSPVLPITVASGSGASVTQALMSGSHTITMNEFVLLCQSSAGVKYTNMDLTFYLTNPFTGGGSGVNAYFAVGSATIGAFNQLNTYQFTATVTPYNGLWGEQDIPIVFDSFSVEATAATASDDTLSVVLQTNGLAVANDTALTQPSYVNPTFLMPGSSTATDMTNGVPLPIQNYIYRADASSYMNAGSYEWATVVDQLPTSNYQTFNMPTVAGRNVLFLVYNGTNETINFTPLYSGGQYMNMVANGGQSTNFYLNPGGGRSGLVMLLPNGPQMQWQVNWSTAPTTGVVIIKICGIDGGA